ACRNAEDLAGPGRLPDDAFHFVLQQDFGALLPCRDLELTDETRTVAATAGRDQLARDGPLHRHEGARHRGGALRADRPLVELDSGLDEEIERRAILGG